MKNILKTGFAPRYCLEDINWAGFEDDDFVAFPIVCFCDIPLSRITDHVQFYGKFGIGMKQSWAIANGLNPVIYVSQTGHVAQLLRKAAEAARVAQATKSDDSYRDNIRSIIGFTKPLTGTITIQGQPVSKAFFQESEWRYFANNKSVPLFLKKASFNDTKQKTDANQLAEQNSILRFTP